MRTFLSFLLVTGILYGQQQQNATVQNWDNIKGPQNSWVYIVFSGYNKIASRIDKMANLLEPEVKKSIKDLPEEIKGFLLNASGNKLSSKAIDLSRPFALIINNPMGGQKPAIIIPIKTGEKLPADYKEINGYVVASSNPLILSQLNAALEKKGKGAITEPSGLVQVHVDLNTIYSTFGPFLQLMIAQQLQKQETTSQTKLASTMLNLFFSLIKDIDDFTVDLDADGDAILANSTVNAKKGSELAGFCENQLSGTSLGELIDTDGFLAADGKIDGIGPLLFDFSDKILSVLIPDSGKNKTFRAGLSKIINKTGNEFAFCENLGDNGITFDSVLQFTGSMDDIRSYFKLFKSSDLLAALNSGVNLSNYQIKESKRNVNGISIDEFKSTIDKKGMNSKQAEAIKKIWGSYTTAGEYAIANGKLVMCGGGSDYSSRMDKILAKVKAGAAGSPDKNPLNVTINLVDLFKLGLRMNGADMQQLSQFEAPPINVQITFSKTSLNKTVTIPIKSILLLASMAKNAF